LQCTITAFKRGIRLRQLVDLNCYCKGKEKGRANEKNEKRHAAKKKFKKTLLSPPSLITWPARLVLESKKEKDLNKPYTKG